MSWERYWAGKRSTRRSWRNRSRPSASPCSALQPAPLYVPHSVASLPKEIVQPLAGSYGNSYGGFNSRAGNTFGQAASYRSVPANANSWNAKSVGALPAINSGFGSALQLVKATNGASAAASATPVYAPTSRLPPTNQYKRPTGVPASVLSTETRQSKIGSGVLVGDSKPAPRPGLASFVAQADDSLASLKALVAEEKASKRSAEEAPVAPTSAAAGGSRRGFFEPPKKRARP